MTESFSEWRDFSDTFPESTLEFFDLEGRASTALHCEPMIVPGLLQTEEYMWEIVHKIYRHPAWKAEKIMESRLLRQRLLGRDAPPALRFILGEEIFLRTTGGPAVMRSQWARLRQLDAETGFSIRVVPTQAGAYPGLAGPFIYLDVPDAEPALYLEGLPDRAEVLTRGHAQTVAHRDRFAALTELTAPLSSFAPRW
jgi:hypothetical protein